MNETNAVVKARRQVYRTVSWVMLSIVLLVLVVVGVFVPRFYIPQRWPWHSNMVVELPAITEAIIEYCSPRILLLATGFLAMVLIVKEILAPPTMRFWVNLVTLLLLLMWSACYVYAMSVPMHIVVQIITST